jgi:hypothetical protein
MCVCVFSHYCPQWREIKPTLTFISVLLVVRGCSRDDERWQQHPQEVIAVAPCASDSTSAKESTLIVVHACLSKKKLIESCMNK